MRGQHHWGVWSCYLLLMVLTIQTRVMWAMRTYSSKFCNKWLVLPPARSPPLPGRACRYGVSKAARLALQRLVDGHPEEYHEPQQHHAVPHCLAAAARVLHQAQRRLEAAVQAQRAGSDSRPGSAPLLVQASFLWAWQC